MEHKQTAQARYIRRKAAEAQEIGPLPAIADPARRAACAESLERFCVTYFPEAFYLKFSTAHKELLTALEETIRRGAVKCIALPRGSGKTTICEVACLWALLYSYRRFCLLVASEGKRAALLLNDLKTWLETNPLLLADFPEVCYPVVALDGVMQRAKTQRVNGERTRLECSSMRIVFPTVGGAATSGARVQCAGITAGNIRGMAATDNDGRKFRPDLVLIDDPSTAESARSPEQNNLRERLIKSDILGLAGPGQRIAALITCTVIAENDLADRLLNHDSNPEFHGVRLPLLRKFPDNLALWRDYWEARAVSEDEGNSYYLKNRSELDRGASLMWEERKNDGDPSPLVTAMNLYLRDPMGFMSEYQNEPESFAADSKEITSDAVAACVHPAGGFLAYTAAVDCHKDLLYAVVMGWDGRGAPSIVDVLYTPDQPRRVFRKYDAAVKLPPTDAGYMAGLRDIIDRLNERYKPHVIAVDVGYEQALTVSAFSAAPNVVGVKGAYYGARSQRLIADYRNTSTQRVGRNWFIQLRQDKSGRYKLLTVDVNNWKTRLAALFTERAVGVCVDPVDVKQLVNHLQAERAVLVESETRRVYEWTAAPGSDNHLLDCCVYNLAAGDYCGLLNNE